MKTFKKKVTISLILFLTIFTANNLFAATNYVSKTGGHISPFVSWANAATNIQDAVDIASSSNIVLVNDGTYYPAEQITVTNNITVKSVNGPEKTFVDGNNTNRCFYLNNYNTIISGFTITNGNACDGDGGGIYCSGSTPVITNCNIIGNLAGDDGGGIFRGTVNNCAISGNSADNNGGGTYDASINNCIISKNSAKYNGGGTYDSTVQNCTITKNQANIGGGLYNSTINNCFISENSAESSGGGASSGTINNSAINENTSDNGGGAANATLNNCTISGNIAANNGGGTYNCTVNNSIVYYNTATSENNKSGGDFLYCCSSEADGVINGSNGNITTVPILISSFHIATNSPCIGAGSSAYTNGVDIDGEAWLAPPSIGCDEFSGAGSLTGELEVAIAANYSSAIADFPIQFSAIVKGKVVGTKWDMNDGIQIPNQGFVTHSWSTAGDYNVVLTAWNDTYPAGKSATVTVHIVDENTIYYVDKNNSSPAAPYTSWATAATDIQTAVDEAAAGTSVLITNEVYVLNSEISVNKLLKIKGTDREKVIVDGNFPATGIRRWRWCLRKYNL